MANFWQVCVVRTQYTHNTSRMISAGVHDHRTRVPASFGIEADR